MSRSNFPHSRLFLGTYRTVVICGPHIQVLDSNSGDVLRSSANFDHLAKDAVLKSGHVRCSAVDASHTYLATSGDDKILKVWHLDELKLLSARELPKKPTGIQFTRDCQTLLVSDKFGDIFSYPLHWTPDPLQPEKPQRSDLTSHENPSGGTLILGHTSLLTSFALSADERYIITSDRDEHVRVSWYPQGWNIEMFCLGHKKYVSSVHLPTFAPQTLISGGGDPTLKFWDWMTGKVKAEVPIWDIVQGHIKIRAAKKGRTGKDVGDVNKHKRKRGKEKEKEIDQGDDGDGDERDRDESSNLNDAQSTEEQLSADGPGELIQVVHKIDSFEIGTRRYLLFSAVGATAIFCSAFPLDIVSPSSPGVRMRHFDFGRPVLDFIRQSSGSIWVLLDGEWSDAVEKGRMVQIVRWDSDADEFTLVEDGPESALLAALNSTCLLPAAPTELESLDLYASLLAMPKNSVEDADGAGDGTSQDSKNKNKEQTITKRQLGRLKNKMALKMAVEGNSGTSGGAGGSKDEEREDKREHKRSKSEIAEREDVVMDES